MQTAIQQRLSQVNPIQLENFDRDFEALLDAIAQKDTGAVAVYLERYHVKPDGVIERIIVRLMGGKIVG